MADDKLKIPEKNFADLIHTAVRAGIGAIPYPSGTFNELFSALVQPPIEKRLDAWRQTVSKELIEIREKISDLSPEAFFRSLQNDDNFMSIVMKATRIAILEHQEEKLKILRNVILNVAVGTDLEEDQQSIFLRFIEDLTPSHIDILRKQTDPIQYLKDKGVPEDEINYLSGHKGSGGIWGLVFPEYMDTTELYNLLLEDLESRKLITVQEVHVEMVEEYVKWGRGLTTIGDQFLNFITRPI